MDNPDASDEGHQTSAPPTGRPDSPVVTEIHSDGTIVEQPPGTTLDREPVLLGPLLPTEALGVHAGVAFSLAIGTEPEHLDADALAVGWNQLGPGRLGRWFLEGLELEGLLGPTQPDEPTFHAIAERPRARMRLTSLSGLILCTAQRTIDGEPREATIENVVVTTKAAIRCAQSRQVRRLAISLLGAGDNGLPVASVADAIVAASLVAASGLTAGSVLQITFLAPTAEEAVLVRGAWAGFTPEGFANDGASGLDLLGVSDEVYALTEMLLLREVQPPMAVGILGGWGSGKSFAMDLMRRRIMEIRSQTVATGGGWGPGASSYVGHVYPIDFNAWTYARADLWAALMQTVMQGLDDQIAVERVLQGTDQLLDGGAWRNLIAMPRELREIYPLAAGADEVEQSLFETLRRIHESDRDSLAEAEEILRSKAAEQDRRRHEVTREVETRLAAEVAVKVQEQTEAPLAAAMQVSGAAALRWFQREVPDLEPPDGSTERTMRDLREAASDVRSLRLPPWRVAYAAVRSKTGAWLCALAATVAAGLLVWAGRWALTTVPVAVLLGLVGPLVGTVRQVTAAFAQETARIRQDLKAQIDAIEATSAHEVDRALATDEPMKSVSEQAGVASLRVEALRARVGLVAEFTSSEELVRTRLEQSTYSSRLGSMQQVSDDLRSLSDSLTVSTNDIHGETKQKLFPRGPARVVLFIDDLDRCPPPKVVEVLEAIQLLLSTGLFVVVVALDVRYVTRALEKEYAGVLDADGEPSGLDYLEKIIQIPYRTRPGLGDAAATYVAGQLRVDASATPSEAAGPGTGFVAGSVAATSIEAGATTGVARALTFTPADLEVVAEVCRVLRLTPRSAKRVTNIVKLVRLVWARRGQYRPDVDDLATAAVMVGLASAHPDWQRRAMMHLGHLRPGDEDLRRPLIEVLAQLPATLGLASSAAGASWSESIDSLARLRFLREVDGARSVDQLGRRSVWESREIVDFVGSFCFVSDSVSI